jgi:Nif-specific regulatory protein
MSEHGHVEDDSRLKAEHDLYLHLLNLGRQKEPLPLLREALALMVELAHARQGYLEIHDDATPSETPRWWIAHGFSDGEIEEVRRRISGGIIAEAMATGKTIATPSALLDPRFSERESVRLEKIETVLCAPIGEDFPRGVVYLQGLSHSGLFAEEERLRAETFAYHLVPLIDRLLDQQNAEEAADPTRELRETLRLDTVIGRSEALAAVLRQVALTSPLDVSVLLSGESGTGKSQLARLIHDNGPRAGKPFVELNCAALPEGLFESELFGFLEGAHSTATRRGFGKVAAAEHGTLFLDEVSEIPIFAQPKLLQLLQSKQYYPLGAQHPTRANVRVIAATNVDLEEAVAQRQFREDLFFRLQVLPVRVPTLAERRDDIPALADYFCKAACERNDWPRFTLSRNAIRAMQAAEWRGNVRQLANAIEAATIRCAGEGSQQIEIAHVFPGSRERPAESPLEQTFQEATRQFQARLLRDTLADTGWNVVETSRRLDLARSHVYNLIRAFGLERHRS